MTQPSALTTVTPTIVGTEMGVASPSTVQTAQWQSWIDQAVYLIGKRLDITTLDLTDVDYVVLQSVVRHARHPEDSTQVSVAVDDASVQRSYTSGVGRVVIPDEFWALLDPTIAETGVASTQMFGEPDVCPPLGTWL